MKKYMLVTPETLAKLGESFANAEELETFVTQMDQVAQEVIFSGQLRAKVPREHLPYVVLKQICVFALFCREHVELLQQLIQDLDCREITAEELQQIKAAEESDG